MHVYNAHVHCTSKFATRREKSKWKKKSKFNFLKSFSNKNEINLNKVGWAVSSKSGQLPSGNLPIKLQLDPHFFAVCTCMVNYNNIRISNFGISGWVRINVEHRIKSIVLYWKKNQKKKSEFNFLKPFSNKNEIRHKVSGLGAVSSKSSKPKFA